MQASCIFPLTIRLPDLREEIAQCGCCHMLCTESCTFVACYRKLNLVRADSIFVCTHFEHVTALSFSRFQFTLLSHSESCGSAGMRISKEEAVEMYARFWIAHHKQNAGSLAREVATSLERSGDHDGHKIWNEVADAIDSRAWDPPLKSGSVETVTAAS